MGNPQERREADLHWFGGIFDGEGCISITKSGRDGTGTYLLSPQARFVTSSDEIANEVFRILTDAGVSYHVGRGAPSKIGSKSTYRVSINGMKRAKRFLEFVSPFLRGKKAEADLVLTFIESRLSKARNVAYSTEEFDIFFKLRDLHGYRLRESSETVRKSLLARYSPNSARKAERAAEMTAPVLTDR